MTPFANVASTSVSISCAATTAPAAPGPGSPARPGRPARYQRSHRADLTAGDTGHRPDRRIDVVERRDDDGHQLGADASQVPRPPGTGQAIAIMVLSMGVVVMAAGIAVDGGYALVQRRTAQNAADFSALAAARIVAVWIADNTNDGTDANVKSRSCRAPSTSAADGPHLGANGSPVYVGDRWFRLVGSGTDPVLLRRHAGDHRPQLGALLPEVRRHHAWSASATATARGGCCAQRIGRAQCSRPALRKRFFNHRRACSAAAFRARRQRCLLPAHLTPEPQRARRLRLAEVRLRAGMASARRPPANTGGCQTDRLPPASDRTTRQIPTAAAHRSASPRLSHDFGSAACPGNKASATAPTGSHGRDAARRRCGTTRGDRLERLYHIVGFTGFQITACDGGKDFEGLATTVLSWGRRPPHRASREPRSPFS